MKWKGFGVSLLIILGMSSFSSCSLERKIARTYLKNFEGKHIWVNFPESMIKTNLKSDNPDEITDINPTVVDSSNNYKSTYLKYLNDSVFLKNCEQSLKNELIALGFQFELQHSDTIDFHANDYYKFTLVQMELEEMNTRAAPEDFRSMLGSNVYGTNKDVEGVGSYYFDKTLNAINLNAWFELKGNPLTIQQFPVLYANHTIIDDIESDIYEGDYMWHYTIFYNSELERIKMSDIYDLARMAGKKYAIYLFDYLLNLNIQEQMPIGKIPKHYYHYDLDTKWLTIWFPERFVELNP